MEGKGNQYPDFLPLISCRLSVEFGNQGGVNWVEGKHVYMCLINYFCVVYSMLAAQRAVRQTLPI